MSKPKTMTELLAVTQPNAKLRAAAKRYRDATRTRPLFVEWWVMKRVGRRWEWWHGSTTERAMRKVFLEQYADGETGTFRLCRIEAHEVERSHGGGK